MKRLALGLVLFCSVPQPTIVLEQRGEFMPASIYIDGRIQGRADRRISCIKLSAIRQGTNIVTVRRVGFPDQAVMITLNNYPGWHIEVVWDQPLRVMPKEEGC